MYTTAGANVMLDALGITHAGAFTDFPADSGAGSNEVSGGSYARQSISYSAAASKSKAKAAGTVLIPIPAGTTVYFLGGFTALTSGSLRKVAPINGGSVKGIGIVAASDDIIRKYAHGLVLNDRVLVETVNNEAIPTGLSITVLYHVITVTTDTFQLSLTQGGAAVNITGNGSLFFQKVIGETYASAGNLDVSSDTYDLLG